MKGQRLVKRIVATVLTAVLLLGASFTDIGALKAEAAELHTFSFHEGWDDYTGCVTDENEMMAYRANGASYNIFGRSGGVKSNNWTHAEYSYRGWDMHLSTATEADIRFSDLIWYGFDVNTSYGFSADGRSIYVTHTIVNNNINAQNITFWAYADVCLDGDDYAQVTAHNTGSFSGVSIDSSKTSLYITSANPDVKFWAGNVGTYQVGSTKSAASCYDSAAAYAVKDLQMGPGQKKAFTVVYTVAAGLEEEDLADLTEGTEVEVEEDELLHNVAGVEPEIHWTEMYDAATLVYACADEGCTYEKTYTVETEEAVTATCTESGRTFLFANFGELYGQTRTYVAYSYFTRALGHQFGEYKSNYDKNGNFLGKETAVCENCGEKDTRSASTAVTPFDPEDITHVCVYGNPVFDWASDYSVCELTLTCADDAAHTVVLTADSQYGEYTINSSATMATCTEDGITNYTAAFSYDGELYTDIKTEVEPAYGHAFGSYVTDRDANGNSLGTATATCANCGETKSKKVFTNPTPAHTHTYGEPVYSWNTDHTACEITLTCTGDASHVVKETATVNGTTNKVTTTTSATCEKNGVRSYEAVFYVANGNYSTRVNVRENALGHSFGEYVKDEAAGTETATCSVCGATDVKELPTPEPTQPTQPEEPETPSNPSEPQPSKCSFKGSYKWNADRTECTATLTCKEDASHVVTLVADTEGSQGYTVRINDSTTCTTDGQKISVASFNYEGTPYISTKYTNLKAYGHSFGEFEEDFDDNNASLGTETATCGRCGATDTRDLEVKEPETLAEPEQPTQPAQPEEPETPAEPEQPSQPLPHEHVYGSPVYTWNGDFTACEMTLTCLGDASHKVSVTAVKGGASDYVATTSTATCLADGVKTCTAVFHYDGAEYRATGYTTAPAYGHSYSVTGSTAATCTADATQTSRCANCGEVKTEVTAPAHGHNYNSEVVDPDCTEGGYTVHTCTYCGDSFTSDETDALDHNYAAAVTAEATCTANGVITYTCTACGDSFTEAIAAHGHQSGEATIENEIAVSCTADGSYDEVVRCTECGAELERNHETVASAGHCYNETVTQEAAHGQNGIIEFTCALCGDSYTEEIEASVAHVMYRTHVQTYGNQSWRTDGEMSGTSGESKRLEAIWIQAVDEDGNLLDGIEYRTHVQTYGWKGWSKNGAMNGTSGEAKRLEAIEIKLTGELAEKYDVYYCVHAQTYGWLNWAKNGASAGTQGLAKRLEGIKIVLVEKGGPAPAKLGTNSKCFVK